MQTKNATLVERESVVIHKGKHILRHDYSSLHSSQMCRLANLHKDAVVERDQRGIRVLLVMRNTLVDKDVMRAFKEAGLAVKPYYEKVAMVGFVGVQRFFIQIIAKFTQITPALFDTEEEAMDWLAE